MYIFKTFSSKSNFLILVLISITSNTLAISILFKYKKYYY